MKTLVTVMSLVLGMSANSPVLAQEKALDQVKETNTTTPEEALKMAVESAPKLIGDLCENSTDTSCASSWLWQTCTLQRPGQVQRFSVSCPYFYDLRNPKLHVWISDAAIPGDHWEARVKAWDANPNVSVTTSPGGVPEFGTSAVVYNYEDPPSYPGFPALLYAEVDCRYLHGVNIFPASASLIFWSNVNSCKVSPISVRDGELW